MTKISPIQMILPIVLTIILPQLQMTFLKNKYEGHKSFHEYLLSSTNQSFLIYDCDNDEIKNIISSFHAKKGMDLILLTPLSFNS